MALKNFNKQEIDQFALGFEELFNSGDFMTMTSFYADDAQLLADNTPLVKGRRALEHFWQTACEGAKKIGIKRTIRIQDFEASGDLGYLTAAVTLQIPGPDKSVTVNLVRDVTIWKCEKDHEWRMIIDISSRNPTQAEENF